VRWPLTLSVAVSLMLAPAASAAVPNACTLLTTAQVEKALGGKSTSRRGFSTRGATTCIWTSSASVMMNLQLLQMSKADFREGLADEPGKVALRGIGELAYVLGGGRTVTVWHRGVAITVAFNSQERLQDAKGVARAAVARL
jgi:hypothetical protein